MEGGHRNSLGLGAAKSKSQFGQETRHGNHNHPKVKRFQFKVKGVR